MPIISQSGKQSYVGQVISTFRKELRVMSDVYTDADYACIWNPETESVDIKQVNILYMGTSSSRIICDITTGEYAEDYEIFLLIQEDVKRERERLEAEREKQARIEDAKRYCHSPAKGMICRAIKGRKVPKGTEGVIFYIRGNRIGFSDDDGTAHWINDNQIETKLDGLDWGEEPEQGWLALQNEIYETRKLSASRRTPRHY